MQTLFEDNAKKRSIVGSGLGMVFSNKRYIVWFWVLNLALAWIGTSAFRQSAHSILDHSLYSQRLIHGFDVSVFAEMLARPEFGPMSEVMTPSVSLAFVFFLSTALFLPGIFAGYGSTYRLPREDFFRACGRNLWRFIRLMIIAGIVMGIVAGILFALNGAIAKKATESTNEVLPFTLRMIGLFIIFLVMTTLRIWFDLAEADVVLNDQRAIRKSIAAGFRHTFHSLGRLLASYVFATIFAAFILVGGIWAWAHFVPSESVVRAFLMSQLILFLLLIPRFWQRGMAVSYWQQRMLLPVVAVTEPAVQEPVPVGAVPEASPIIPATAAPTQET
jgi:type III secretory pathway component EscS